MFGLTATVLSCCFLLQVAECKLSKRGIENLPPGGIVTVRQVTSADGVDIECAISTKVNLTDDFIASLNINNISEFVFLDENGDKIPENCTWPADDHVFDLNMYFGQCANSIQQYFDMLFVNYTLCVVPEYDPAINIARDQSTTVAMSCIFRRDVIVSDYYLQPVQEKIQVDQFERDGDFVLQMSRSDSDLANVTVPDPLHITVAIIGGFDASLIMQMRRCYATPTNNPDDPLKYSIIYDGCAADTKPWELSNQVNENFDTEQGQFQFNSFVWTDRADDKIFVHCQVTICPEDLGFMCKDHPCAMAYRKRRSLPDERLKTKTISLGPFLVNKKETCDKMSMGCEYDCSLEKSTGKEFCVCPFGFVLSSDGVSCDQDTKIVQNVHRPAPTLYVVKATKKSKLPIVAFTALCITLLVCLFVATRPAKKEVISKAAEAKIAF